MMNAFDDSKYLGAIKSDEAPKSTKNWTLPTAEEKKLFLDKLKSETPEKLSNEFICSGSLGFYLVSLLLQFSTSSIERTFSLPTVYSLRAKLWRRRQGKFPLGNGKLSGRCI